MEAEKFTFFWKSNSPFSNWYPAEFVIDGIKFNCSEQYMMYGKARLFEDHETAKQILAADRPGKQKDLGRKVRGFKDEIWRQNARDIVYRANEAKFLQNEALLKHLLNTGKTILVEASPVDPIWGIGLAEDHPDAKIRQKWRGKNWLGEVLTRLRDDLLTKQ